MGTTYAALRHRFSIDIDEEPVADYLADVLAPLVHDGAARHHYRIAQEPSGWALTLDRIQLVGERDRSGVLDHLFWHINRQAVAAERRHLLIHASAATTETGAVVMPAPMESGKTTLVAGMVLRGFRYLTDEAVAIDPSTLKVHPYPKPLTIERGSFDVLAELRPDLDPDVARWVGDQWHVRPTRIRPDAIAGPTLARAVISPRYSPGGGTALKPLDRADALVLLVDSCFNLRRFGERGFRALAQFVRQCECHRLDVDDLGLGVEAVATVMSSDRVTS